MDNEELQLTLNTAALLSEFSEDPQQGTVEGITIDLSGFDLTYENIETICDFIGENELLIEKINLSNTNLNDKKLAMICDKLKDCNHLKNINFSNNKLENVKPLEQVINRYSIKEVDLSENFIKDVNPIAKGLNKTQIKNLNLDNNLIKDIAPIAKAMKDNKTIEFLSLERNYLDDNQAKKLSDSITNSTTLEELDLEKNAITNSDLVKTPEGRLYKKQFHSNAKTYTKKGGFEKHIDSQRTPEASEKKNAKKQKKAALNKLDDIQEMLEIIQSNVNEREHGSIPGDIKELINTVEEIKKENKGKSLKEFDLKTIDKFKNTFNGVYDDMMKYNDLNQKFGGRQSLKDWINETIDSIKDACMGKKIDTRTKDKLNLIGEKINRFKPEKGTSQSTHTPSTQNRDGPGGHSM